MYIPIKKRYEQEAVKQLQEKYHYSNRMMVPKIEKIIINIGANRVMSEKYPDYVKWLKETIRQISGQNPLTTLAKKSISNFKIRENMIVGVMVTLRGQRMYDFLDKFLNTVLPRTRDFKGINPDSIDKQGNFSLGFKEQVIFPEIDPAAVSLIHGLEITIVTNAREKIKAYDLFKALGFPFVKSAKKLSGK
jgi:large subunit ribosomal protein L5